MGKSGFLILLIVVLSILQTYLAKKRSKWVGLILPLITFVFSLFLLIISPNYISSNLIIFITFILVNIPTAIYLIIFFIYRDKNKQSEVDKMNIQDLE